MASPLLLLNCFPVTLSPTDFSLPFVDFGDYETSTEALAKEFRSFSAYRYELDTKRIRVILLNGPERLQALDSATVNIVALPFFGARLIQQTLSEYFSSKGLRISHEMSTTRVVLSAPVFSEGPVAIYTGIEFQVRRPFKSLPENYVLSAQWKASVSFRHSLADDSLRGLAVGTPVLFRPLANANLPPEVRGFRNRYIGHVQSVGPNNRALVLCKDGQSRELPLDELFPEGSPAVIRKYENLAGRRTRAHSIWHRVQEADLALTKAGRRNSSVLRDRLQAIRAFLAAGPKDELVLRAACFEDAIVTVGLSPMRVEII